MSTTGTGWPADLRADTAVWRRAGRSGAYRAELSERWSYLYPSGGVMMTIALRAIAAELDQPALRLVGATTTFCSALPAGPLDIDVTVLRRGRRASQARAALRVAGAEGVGLEVAATFGIDRELGDLDVASPPMPEVVGPAAAERFEDSGRVPPPFSRNFEVRRALGDVWWRAEWPRGAPLTGRWFRYRVPQQGADGALDPLALPPIADTMASAYHQAIGSREPPVYVPSLDLTVHFLRPARPGWLLVLSRCRSARVGYVTGDAEVWDEQGQLIAVAGQTMFIRAPRAGR